jgi:diguanylate cyclase (GGDEF)-like protein
MDAHSGTRYFVSVQRDVTARKIATQQLVYQAFHDALTGLPNRNLFFERLEHAMARSKRNRENFAVLFVDLDGFKNVNDSLGHAAGDAFLIEIARRLETCVRPGDSVARLGGDEFTILLEGIADQADATNITGRILTSIAELCLISGQEMQCTASVGIAFQEPKNNDAQELLRHADLALYLAKSHGKSRYEIYSKQ